MSKALEGLIVCAMLLMLAAGCGGGSGEDSAERSLTQRERDSVLAESPIPGARGVKTILTVADSANARTERLNDLTK
jgi:hypothetical protein